MKNMHSALLNSPAYLTIVSMLVFGSMLAVPSLAAEPLSPAQQTALVKKYCAVCHTDAAKNGGLSLEHYDAAQPDPALAAMLLSKLQNGAMGAAGFGSPDAATGDAWIAATAAQAEQARQWTVIRSQAHEKKQSVIAASIIVNGAPRDKMTGSQLYRLALTCDTANQDSEILLTWSPQPQTDRTFFVSSDGDADVEYKLEGREKMGNGASVTSGLASAKLKTPLPAKTLAIRDLFPGETVVFPIDKLKRSDRRELASCLAAPTASR